MIDEQRNVTISVIPFCQGEIFDLKIVKYFEGLKTQSHIHVH